jgi:hypothetical protein
MVLLVTSEKAGGKELFWGSGKEVVLWKCGDLGDTGNI